MIRIRNLSLGAKVLATTAIAVLVGFGVMTALIIRETTAQAEQQGFALAEAQAQRLAVQVGESFNKGFAVARSLGDAMQGLRHGKVPDRDTLDRVHKELLEGATFASGLWTLWEPNGLDGRDERYKQAPKHDATGRYLPYFTRSAGGAVRQDTAAVDADMAQFRRHPDAYVPIYEKEGDGDYYVVPRRRNRDTVIGPYNFTVQGRNVLMTSLVSPIHDNGRFIGVAALDIWMEALQKELARFKPYGTGYVTLVSQDAHYVAGPHKEWLGKTVADHIPSRLFEALKAGKLYRYEADGFVHFYQPIEIDKTGQYWAVGVSVPLEAVMADAQSLKVRISLLALLSVAVIVAVLAAVLTLLTRPLRELQQAMANLATGSGDLTRRIAVNAGDEVGKTAAAFNDFTEHLRSLMLRVQEESIAVRGATAQLTHSAAQVAQNALRQAETTRSTSAAVEQVSASVQQSACTAAEAAEKAGMAGRQSEHSLHRIHAAAEEIHSITATVGELGSTLSTLDRRSDDVTRIVQVIKDVAEQTNLLALNAAIEAARAGEQGRGFAVVADEVRKLAHRSGEATQDIAQIVDAIRSDMKLAGAKMASTSAQIDACLSLSQEASTAMRSAHEESNTLVANIIDISGEMREQSSASAQIARHVERIDAMAQENEAIAHVVDNAVHQLEQRATSLAAIVAGFRL
ncbi:methyl-accepting chemotaxis protein [Crenobacter sp. SG2303]|uniref:Methyl-accepting chemotaxis protein n=1 Tax=Crenobacter oryzisoli TaxID=3056844 RepID=A0ABT7XLD2_9NEIS|nr:methyl-accepting chemotaxis protein [Crenobacter sp. SG2303]MDN0074578.1 methyl-accepting chemotaxis protein [Crenobacter sp. SG2303]